MAWLSSGLGFHHPKKVPKLRGGEEGRSESQGAIFPRPKTQRRSRSSHARGPRLPSYLVQPVCCGRPASQPFLPCKLVIGCSPPPPPRPIPTWASPSRFPACEYVYSIISLALRDFHAANRKRAGSSTTCIHSRASKGVGSGPRNIIVITTHHHAPLLLQQASFPHFGTLAHHDGAWVGEPIPVQSYQMPLLIHPLPLDSHRGSTRHTHARGLGRANVFIRCPSVAHSSWLLQLAGSSHWCRKREETSATLVDMT